MEDTALRHLRQCGVNVIGPHTLIGSDTIRTCGFVGVRVALLEKCVTVGMGFKVFYMFRPCLMSQLTFCCLQDQDVTLKL